MNSLEASTATMAVSDVAECVERATSDMLIGPDWATNIELCDIINNDPSQAKIAIKLLKKPLVNKNEQVQLLALTVLETLSKNSGDCVHTQIVECGILNDMVRIVKNKPNLGVKEKILTLIDAWQFAFGGSAGRHPQYHAAYQELRDAGVDFPPRDINAAPLFEPSQTQPIHHPPEASEYGNFRPWNTYGSTPSSLIPANRLAETSVSRRRPHDFGYFPERVHFDSPAAPVIPVMSSSDIKSAQEILNILDEMLSAVDHGTPEGVKNAVVVDLVEQSRSNQKRIEDLVHNTRDEGLLFQALGLNDELHRVLQRYDGMVKQTHHTSYFSPTSSNTPNDGIRPMGRANATRLSSVVNANEEDDDSEDDFLKLSRRSTKSGTASAKSLYSTRSAPLLPPPPSAKNPVNTEAATCDYLSGESFASFDALDAPIVPGVTPPNTSSELREPSNAPSHDTTESHNPPSDEYSYTAHSAGEYAEGYNGLVAQMEQLTLNPDRSNLSHSAEAPPPVASAPAATSSSASSHAVVQKEKDPFGELVNLARTMPRYSNRPS